MRATFITIFSGLGLLASVLVVWLSYESLKFASFRQHGGFLRCGTPLIDLAFAHLGFAVLGAFPLVYALKRVPVNQMNLPLRGVMIAAGVVWEVNAVALWIMRNWLIW